jgi:DNA polymerase III gamma/tau subunit
MSAENTRNKTVNVHGIRFDISSILNDVTASIQNNIQKSLDGALKDYELYKSTHDAILQIPFVRELYIQNQELISQLDQPIHLKIDEILPPPSPVVMRSYFQFGSNDIELNKKLSSDEEESTSTIQSESSSEAEEEEEEISASASEEEEEASASASEAEEEEEASASASEAEAEEEEEASASEVEAEVEEEEEASASESEEEEAISASAKEEEEAEASEAEAEAEESEESEEAISASAKEPEKAEAEAEAEAEEAEISESEAEEEVYEIVIKNVTYFTTNENDGDIYSCVDGDVGEIVGKFKNKKPVFARRK